MEESIQNLISFLNEISWAETEADELRAKLSSSRSISRRIFEQIDKENKGRITSDDICKLCQSQGLPTGEAAVEIVGRYFQNWNKGINESQFQMALKPKSLIHQSPKIKQKEEFTTFVSLINVVVTSFQNLQILRVKFSQNWEDIVSYFMTDYDCNEVLTKESLREFMLCHKIYSRPKFSLISGYIFGDNQESISWQSFFKIQRKADKNIVVIETSSRMLTQKSVEKLKRKQSQPEQERSSRNNSSQKGKKQPSKQQSEDIDNVLSQIEQIQNNMKRKKLKTQTSVEQMLPPERLNSKTPTQQTIQVKDENDEQRKSCFGKSGSKIKKTVRLEEFDLNMGQTEWRKECFDIGKHTKRSIDFQNFVHKPITFPGASQNDYLTVHKRSLSRGQSMRTSSEAQLKINEIERRAMDKFLSSRRASHLPNDEHIPYFYQTMRPNFEMTRKMGRAAFNMDGISSFVSPTSRISSLLNTKIDRAVSPKYFRS